MEYTTIIFILEIIGTIAFASSGAMVGIRKNMDIFSVTVLGITTATGGGCYRYVYKCGYGNHYSDFGVTLSLESAQNFS